VRSESIESTASKKIYIHTLTICASQRSNPIEPIKYTNLHKHKYYSAMSGGESQGIEGKGQERGGGAATVWAAENERDAERKREEEEAKKARDAAAATKEATTEDGQGNPTGDKDMPDAGINDHLNDVNTGWEGKDGEGAAATPAVNLNFGGSEEEDDDDGESPNKKRNRRTTRRRKSLRRRTKERRR
jgi:hypothetical protein